SWSRTGRRPSPPPTACSCSKAAASDASTAGAQRAPAPRRPEPAMPALFRPEAVEARARHRLGEVSLAQPPGTGLLATLAVGAVVLVLAWLATGEYTHRSRVAGQLVPDRGLATLAAPEAGTVLEVFAAEGTAVTRNAPLVVVATARVTQTGGDTTAALLARLDERR